MTLTELLDDLGIAYRESGHRHVTAGWIGLHCPFCGDTAFKLGVSLQHYNCSCWGCGPHRLGEVLVEATGLPWHQIKPLLGQFAPSTAPTRLKRTRLRLPSGLGPLLPPHQKYLQQRGYCVPTLEKLWNLQGIGLHPELAWRVFIPIKDVKGETVSWTTRSLADTGRRYIAASTEEEALPAKSLLFGEDYCRHAIIVTEGPFDAMRIGPGAVATMGTAYTLEQIAKIAKYPVRVICFDAEDNAQRRSREMLETLAAVPGQTFNVRLDSKDPGSASEEEISELRKRFLE